MEVEIIKANSRFSENKTVKNNRIRVCAYCRVSTDTEEQEKSYESMVRYYDEVIDKNPDWQKVGIYADKGFTGTKAINRTEFQRMINDCLEGKIDLVLTKSLSRFARNTLDALKYVRLLKENNVGIIFENENINTLKDGEFLMTILSSVAQQEVENTSANVKKGLKMKMERGVMVGFSRCEGYKYDKNKKTIDIVEDEAEIIRYIFDRYTSGVGSQMLAKELNEKGLRTWKGYPWSSSGICEIIRNEKYVGDVKMGKTYSTDPISKRRIANLGEEDMYYIRNHHKPIISREQFEKAQALRTRRNIWNRDIPQDQREPFTRKYAFSCIGTCGFCGHAVLRRMWYSRTNEKKHWIWQCSNYVKNGKSACNHSRGIHEDVIEEAFVASYNMLRINDNEILNETLKRIEKAIRNNSCGKQLENLKREEEEVKRKRKFLLEKFSDGIISEDVYKENDSDYDREIRKIQKKIRDIKPEVNQEEQVEERIKEIEKTLNSGTKLEEFDRDLFDCVVERVILGGFDNEGNIDPYKITFVYKSGPTDSQYNTRERFRKIIKEKNHSSNGLKVENNYSKHAVGTRRDGCSSVPTKTGRSY